MIYTGGRLGSAKEDPRALIICRAGDSSLHVRWLGKKYDNIDLAISYYGQDGKKYRGDGVYYERAGGTKYPSLYKLITGNLGLILGYDIVWLPDDDLDIDIDTVKRLFTLFGRYGLWLAQPALTADSPHSHSITLRSENSVLRYTNFVESMAPVFSVDALLKCLPTFKKSVSGWGIDAVWPKLLGMPKDRIAVIDAAAAVHTRPPWSGELYRRLKLDPWEEMKKIAGEYGITLPYRMTTYGSVP